MRLGTRAARAAVATLASALILAACGEGPGTPTQLQPGQLAVCSSSTAISAARIDGVVRFSWGPTCGASGFIVANQSGAATLWSVSRSDGLATMPGPIVYGTAPAGTVASGGAPPLQAGQVVRVSLTGAANGGTSPGGEVTSAQITVP